MGFFEVRNLVKYFGGLAAVNNVTFEVNQGEIFGLIGPNGSGKSTIFNLISNYFGPTSGTIHFKEVLAKSLPIGERKRLEITRAMATQPDLLLLDETAQGNRRPSKPSPP